MSIIAVILIKSSLIGYASEFEDIFDVDHFITSLRDEVRVLKELPPRLKKRVELGFIYTMAPVSWSDISYYHNQVGLSILFIKAPLLQTYYVKVSLLYAVPCRFFL